MPKLHCWEVKGCGRQPGGRHQSDLGVCPAATENRLDGIHGGRNAGRACWVVSGTMCNGEIQGTFAKKFGSCMQCDFYKLVQDQEFPNFVLSASLLTQLKR